MPRVGGPNRHGRRTTAGSSSLGTCPSGEQAQVDFGQLQVWIADVETSVHFFVFTLGFSRRAVAYAYRNERQMSALMTGWRSLNLQGNRGCL